MEMEVRGVLREEAGSLFLRNGTVPRVPGPSYSGPFLPLDNFPPFRRHLW